MAGSPRQTGRSTPLEVEDRVLASAVDCTKDARCVAGPPVQLCRVRECVRGKVHFIECAESGYCSYQMSFGEGFVCNCPVRKAIYNRYGI